MSKVVVIGGGAAGMIAAVRAAENGHSVILFERNEKTGKKLFITGKGRCNLTNACDQETLFQNMVTNGKFLYSSFYAFDQQAVISFFEQSGCKTKTERGDRVFPLSDHSSDVIAALNREMKKRNVRLILNQKVTGLKTRESKISGVELADGTAVDADAVILAAGGASYPSTGSDGSGYLLAKKLGHTIKEPVPALVPLEIEEEWCGKLMGLSLRNVGLKMTGQGKRPLFEGFGEMLFTHFGVSGPLILSASSYYPEPGKRKDIKLLLDLKPALSKEQLDKRILRDFEKTKNKCFKNALDELLPLRLIPVIITMTGIDPEKKVNEITKEERKILTDSLKQVVLTVKDTRGFPEAVITRGGISVREVNPSTMESKLIKGLYFAGEILDVDALTGGFNLQIAWSTGYLAGDSIAEETRGMIE